ncbi:LysR family transcriptional regulator [Brevibacillus ginsengisoli]|uniref:LysR family transcriptional regulator n=1 Tax=Brevibacillus ginsengisoli TaxID=363854 RepID=UPI003CF558AA
MEFRQLEYFHVVCKHKNFTHAAEELHISQPSITNSIHKLEEELGVQLLRRNTKKVAPTPKGELFNKRVATILMHVKDAVTEITDTNAGKVKFGLPPMIGAQLFPNLFIEFQKALPDINLHVCEKGSSAIHEMLVKDELELGFMILPPHSEAINMLPFTQEDMMVCLPHDHYLAGERELSLEQLRDERFIFLSDHFMHHQIIVDECKQHGYLPNIAFTTDNYETLKSLVANGAGLSLLINMVVKDNDEIVKIPLKRPIQLSIGLAWKKDKQLSQNCLDIIDFFRQYFGN